MKEAKTIIGFINTTLKGYKHTVGELEESRVHKIILALIGSMPVDKTCREVCKYCEEHYNLPNPL